MTTSTTPLPIPTVAVPLEALRELTTVYPQPYFFLAGGRAAVERVTTHQDCYNCARRPGIVHWGHNDYCAHCLERHGTLCATCNQFTFGGHSVADGIYCNHCVQYCSNCRRWHPKTSIIRCCGRELCPTCNEAHMIHCHGPRLRNTSTRTVGFETECIVRDGFDRENLLPWGRVGDDGSIHNFHEDERSIEFASTPMRGDAVLDAINKVLTIIAREGDGRVNESCGTHVHISVENDTDEGRANIADWWNCFEPLFFHLVPKSRRRNQYCRPATYYRDQGYDRSEWRDMRYSALNVNEAYHEHGTFEVRLHQGTLNPERLSNWVMFLLSFFDTFCHIRCTGARRLAFQDLSDREQLLFLFQQLRLPMSLRKELLHRERRYRSLNIYENLVLSKSSLDPTERIAACVA